MGIFHVDIDVVTSSGGDVERHEVLVRLAGRERTVIAFFADETAPKLVGAQTLESFGLGVDPLGRRLVPVDAYLAAGARIVMA